MQKKITQKNLTAETPTDRKQAESPKQEAFHSKV